MQESAKTIKRICLECKKELLVDIHHISQIRHLECARKHDVAYGKEYYKEYLKPDGTTTPINQKYGSLRKVKLNIV